MQREVSIRGLMKMHMWYLAVLKGGEMSERSKTTSLVGTFLRRVEIEC